MANKSYVSQLDAYLTTQGITLVGVDAVPDSKLEDVAHDILAIEAAFHRGELRDTTNEPL
jgi:hypothetical protein